MTSLAPGMRLQHLFLVLALAFAGLTPIVTLAQDDDDGDESEVIIDDDGDDGDDDAPVTDPALPDTSDDDGTDDPGDDGVENDDGDEVPVTDPAPPDTDEEDGADDPGDDGVEDDDGDDDDADDVPVTNPPPPDTGDDDGGDDPGDDGVEDDDGDADDGDDVPVTNPPPPDTDDDDQVAPEAPAPVQDDDDDDDLDDPRPNQAIVRLVPGVDGEAFATRHGARVLRTIPAENIYLYELESDRADDDEVADLNADPDVVYAEPNYTAQAPEGRPRYFFTSGEGRPRPVDGVGLPEELNLPDRSCVSGSSVVVAVLDTGVDPGHPLIVDAILPNGVNMVDNTFDVADAGNGADDDGDGAVDEMVGHGTHVAGIVIQVAPSSEILPIKVLDSDGVGDAFYVAAGIYYALEQDADVINLSLGSTYQSRTITEAVEDAVAQDVPVIAAAGNAGVEEPAEYPAAEEAAFGVAATDADGNKADFSNFSIEVDISAPGVDIASAYPENQYVTATGTSMAAPLVTGTVALMLDQDGDLAADELMSRIAAGADPIPAAGSAWDGKVGAGRLNVGASIDCSIRG